MKMTWREAHAKFNRVKTSLTIKQKNYDNY